MPANFNQVQISPNYWYGQSQYAQSRSMGYVNGTDDLNSYVHIKTNLGGDDSMWTVDAVGYNYGQGYSIRCTWSWYSYGYDIYQVALSGPYGGLDPQAIYAASDGYTVLVGAASMYYIGFTLNAYNMRQNASGQPNPAILAYGFSNDISPIY